MGKIAPDDKFDAEKAKIYLKGQILWERGFMSTSLSKSIAHRFAHANRGHGIVLTILLPAGTRYWPIFGGGFMQGVAMNLKYCWTRTPN